MADSLISVAVGGAMGAVSAAAVGYSVAKIKKEELYEKKVPLMAVTGAFVFAAQMVNITLPGTGSSGHIGGGTLLAAMLGGPAALLAISSVLIIQCLFFADGGLLALGCNIFNMGVIPCLVVYPLIFKPLMKNKIDSKRICAASVASAVVGLQLGAFGVTLETLVSGITGLPFLAFVLLMQPIHLAIGIVEGAITAAVLCFVHKMRPEILPDAGGQPSSNSYSARKLIVALAALTLVTAGIFSVFASQYPDGLEWAVEKITGADEPEPAVAVAGLTAIQDATAIMPDYEYKSAGEEGSATGTSAAGLLGGAMTFVLAGGAGLLISAVKKSKKRYA